MVISKEFQLIGLIELLIILSKIVHVLLDEQYPQDTVLHGIFDS